MPESNKPMPHVGDPIINFNGSSKTILQLECLKAKLGGSNLETPSDTTTETFDVSPTKTSHWEY